MLYTAIRTIRLRLLLLVLLIAVATPRLAESQLKGKIADKPIAIGYLRNVTQKTTLDYVLNLTERLNIGTTMRTQLGQENVQEQLEGSQPKVDEPVYGVAWYMVTGLIPSYDTITFQPVIDEADALRLMNGEKRNFGDNGFVEDLGNNCYKAGYRYSSESPLPEGYDESQIANSNNNQQPGGWKSEQKIIEKDGKKFLQHNQSYTQYCRFYDNVLYKAAFEEIFEMELPTAGSITTSISSENDLGFDAYLDRIPVGIRQLGWNMLSAAIGTQLQQRDDEPEASYNMRRSSGDLGLAMAKAVLFDIDNSSGWMHFASADDDSLRGEFRIRSRNNSELTKQLQSAAGLSQFAPILNDNAAATIHVCVRFPEEAPTAILAAGTWLQEEIDRESKGDPGMVDAARVLSETLAGIADHRNLELLAKAGWSDASGGVFYGGIQVNENPDLLRSLHYFMTHSGETPPNVEEIITLSEEDGRPIIRFNVPPQEVEKFAEISGMRISHAYLIHEGNRLWFAAGAENAKEMLRQSIDRCNSGGLAYQTPLLTAKIDMKQWLDYPLEDASGIAPLPRWLDENAWWFPPTPISVSNVGMMGDNPGKPEPIMQRVFDLGGSQQGSLTVQADESGILIQAALGEALANHMVARMIEAQEGMMKRSQEAQTKALEAQKKALEEASKNVQPPALPE
jgi:hypothetical protein